MKKYKHRQFLVACFIILLNIVFSSYVFAQKSSFSFGDMKAAGHVQIQSSTGKWVDMQPLYPLLSTTKLRTNGGVVMITTREGSRIDISKDTELSINAMHSGYSVNLVQGTITFNIVSTVSFAVITPEATVSVSQQFGGRYNMVAGPGVPTPTTIQGIVIRDDNGTFIRDISGKMSITHVSKTLVLSTGETFYAGAGDHSKAAGALIPNHSNLTAGLICGAFFTTGTITAFEAFRGAGRASPEGF